MTQMMNEYKNIVDASKEMADQLAAKGINIKLLTELVGGPLIGMVDDYILSSGRFYNEISTLYRAVCLKEKLIVK